MRRPCRTFQRVLDLRNDLGLLSEEYDPQADRLVGNFPQAFSHVPLIDTARRLSAPVRPEVERTT
jgi:GH15 family glucan-1,4-alpha-glucosidase